MNFASEYILNEYDELKGLNDKKTAVLVRNRVSGKIAVKKHLPLDMEMIYRFLQEHNSKYLPEIYELIPTDNELILIEEYVDGQTAADIVRQKPLEEQRALEIILDLCAALAPLHEADPPVICRDITSNNVMITADGKTKLIDFNISRMVTPGKNQDTVLLGTRGYAAPEQFGFGQTDARTDIYAIGVLLNFLLTGKHFTEEMTVLPIRSVIEKCVQMNPNDRYETVRKLGEAIEVYYIKYYGFRNAEAEEKVSRTKTGYAEPQTGYPDYTADKGNIGWRRFLPPGFRTLTGWKMLLSSVVYFLWTLLMIGVKLENSDGTPYTPAESFATKLVFWISEILTILIAFNYLGIRDKLPIAKSKNVPIRVIGVALYNFLILMVLLMIIVAMGY